MTPPFQGRDPRQGRAVTTPTGRKAIIWDGADLGGWPVPARYVAADVRAFLLEEALVTSDIRELLAIYQRCGWTAEEAVRILVAIARDSHKDATRLAAVRFLEQLRDTALERSGLIAKLTQKLDEKGRLSQQSEAVRHIAAEAMGAARRELASSLGQEEPTNEHAQPQAPVSEPPEHPGPPPNPGGQKGHVPPPGETATRGLAGVTRHPPQDAVPDSRQPGAVEPGNPPVREVASVAQDA